MADLTYGYSIPGMQSIQNYSPPADNIAGVIDAGVTDASYVPNTTTSLIFLLLTIGVLAVIVFVFGRKTR